MGILPKLWFAWLFWSWQFKKIPSIFVTGWFQWWCMFNHGMICTVFFARHNHQGSYLSDSSIAIYRKPQFEGKSNGFLEIFPSSPLHPQKLGWFPYEKNPWNPHIISFFSWFSPGGSRWSEFSLGGPLQILGCRHRLSSDQVEFMGFNLI